MSVSLKRRLNEIVQRAANSKADFSDACSVIMLVQQMSALTTGKITVASYVLPTPYKMSEADWLIEEMEALCGVKCFNSKGRMVLCGIKSDIVLFRNLRNTIKRIMKTHWQDYVKETDSFPSYKPFMFGIAKSISEAMIAQRHANRDANIKIYSKMNAASKHWEKLL